jgi:hypothetical protein
MKSISGRYMKKPIVDRVNISAWATKASGLLPPQPRIVPLTVTLQTVACIACASYMQRNVTGTARNSLVKGLILSYSTLAAHFTTESMLKTCVA